MGGAVAALLGAGGELYRGVLTIGDDGGPTAYGYAYLAYGSLTPLTFKSRDGNTRTILGVGYNTGTAQLVLTLSGSVSNTDAAAFRGFVIPGVGLYLRSAATYSSPSNSNWVWSEGSNVIGTSGTRSLVLI